MEYQRFKLQDLIKEFYYGTMPKEEDMVEDGFPINSGYRVVGYTNKYNIKEDTLIVIARGVGGTGKVKIVPAKTFLTNLSIALIHDKEKIDLRYAYYYLNQQGLRYLDSGAAQSQITINNLKKHIVFIPPKKQQNKIASILSIFDDLIEKNNRKIAILQKMAEELYKEWFVRFRFPGYKTTKFKDGIPEGWEVDKIKNKAKRLPFNRLYKEFELEEEGKVIVIDQSEKEFLGFHNNEPSHIASYEDPICLFGDHSCKFQLMTQPFSLGENVVPFKGNNINSYYLFYSTHKIIETEEYKRHWGLFVSKKILIPPMALQRNFEKHLVTIHKQIDTINKCQRLLIKQRDLLLPRLMSGKLEVKA